MRKRTRKGRRWAGTRSTCPCHQRRCRTTTSIRDRGLHPIQDDTSIPDPMSPPDSSSPSEISMVENRNSPAILKAERSCNSKEENKELRERRMPWRCRKCGRFAKVALAFAILDLTFFSIILPAIIKRPTYKKVLAISIGSPEWLIGSAICCQS